MKFRKFLFFRSEFQEIPEIPEENPEIPEFPEIQGVKEKYITIKNIIYIY